MRRLASSLICAVLLATAAPAQPTPQVPVPQGFVTDLANVIDPATRTKMTRLLQELQQKTGAEIAVLTVESTAPLDDFTYAMQVADAWRPGKKGEDTGALVLVAVRDRKVRVQVGYGLEGILPDGLVGSIQDREMVPEFRAGRMGEGIWRGVAALANRVAADRGVTLTGVPAPRSSARQPPPVPFWAIVLIFIVLMIIASRIRGGGGGPGFGPGRRRRGGPIIFPGGFGGFGGGGGGFGGFGGGGFGGGGAGRSW